MALYKMGSIDKALPHAGFYPDSQNERSDIAKIDIFLFSSKYFRNYFKFWLVFGLKFKISSYFCSRICPLRPRCHLWMTEPMGGALHIRRRYWRFVVGCSKLRNFWIAVHDNAGVTPRGVVYTLRSVLRGLTMSSLAHFTVYSILPRGCFSVCFSQRLWKARILNRQMQAPAFFICSYQQR